MDKIALIEKIHIVKIIPTFITINTSKIPLKVLRCIRSFWKWKAIRVTCRGWCRMHANFFSEVCYVRFGLGYLHYIHSYYYLCSYKPHMPHACMDVIFRCRFFLWWEKSLIKQKNKMWEFMNGKIGSILQPSKSKKAV